MSVCLLVCNSFCVRLSVHLRLSFYASFSLHLLVHVNHPLSPHTLHLSVNQSGCGCLTHSSFSPSAYLSVSLSVCQRVYQSSFSFVCVCLPIHSSMSLILHFPLSVCLPVACMIFLYISKHLQFFFSSLATYEFIALLIDDPLLIFF